MDDQSKYEATLAVAASSRALSDYAGILEDLRVHFGHVSIADLMDILHDARLLRARIAEAAE